MGGNPQGCHHPQFPHIASFLIRSQEKKWHHFRVHELLPFPFGKVLSTDTNHELHDYFSLIQLSLEVQSKEENDCHRSKPKPSLLFNGSVTASGFLFSLTVNSILPAILFCY